MEQLAGYSAIAVPAGLLLLWGWLTVRTWRAPGTMGHPGRWAVGTTLAFILLDGGLAAALPWLGLSFGPVEAYWIILLSVRSTLYALSLLALIVSWIVFRLSARIRGATNRSPKRSPHGIVALTLLWLLNLALVGGVFYASYIEPFHLTVTEVDLPAPDLALDRPLRILHLTDPHVERTTKRERAVVALADELEPDLIVLTGDYLNIGYLDDEIARRDARELLAQLDAPYGVYAVNGNVDPPATMDTLFEGLDITVLEDQVSRLPLGGDDLYIVGVNNWEWSRDRAALSTLSDQVPEEAYTVLLYHTPDLIETAAAAGIDLYLAGHTHGGQVRLPGYGAMFTSSRYGKRFEQGQHRVGPTTLYVSRGLGMEGFWITPRVRFLCPPEVVVLNLIPGEGP